MKYLQDLVPGCSKVVVVQHSIPQVIARSGLSVVFLRASEVGISLNSELFLITIVQNNFNNTFKSY